MYAIKFSSLLIILIAFCQFATTQDSSRKIEFPDVEGFKTLKCDFHIHTVFSDGLVWPTIRIDEAVRDGLDAISLTEHLEYQPWIEDIPHPDRNRSFAIAQEAAKPYDLIVIHGTEITRNLPPGHANALFISDANELMVADSLEVFRKAKDQGAFIFWNHPNWIVQQKDGLPTITTFHQTLIDNNLLHGIEVVNDLTFSEEALQLAIDNNLSVMGTSDIHGLVDYQFDLMNGGHRPICLVFAKERSETSIKEALFKGRTVTWFNNILSGKVENMKPLIEASLTYSFKGYIGDSEILQLKFENKSDAKFILQNISSYDFMAQTNVIEILPHSDLTLQILSSSAASSEALQFKIMNAVIGQDSVYHMIIPLER